MASMLRKISKKMSSDDKEEKPKKMSKSQEKKRKKTAKRKQKHGKKDDKASSDQTKPAMAAAGSVPNLQQVPEDPTEGATAAAEVSYSSETSCGSHHDLLQGFQATGTVFDDSVLTESRAKEESSFVDQSFEEHISTSDILGENIDEKLDRKSGKKSGEESCVKPDGNLGDVEPNEEAKQPKVEDSEQDKRIEDSEEETQSMTKESVTSPNSVTQQDNMGDLSESANRDVTESGELDPDKNIVMEENEKEMNNSHPKEQPWHLVSTVADERNTGTSAQDIEPNISTENNLNEEIMEAVREVKEEDKETSEDTEKDSSAADIPDIVVTEPRDISHDIQDEPRMQEALEVSSEEGSKLTESDTADPNTRETGTERNTTESISGTGTLCAVTVGAEESASDNIIHVSQIGLVDSEKSDDEFVITGNPKELCEGGVTNVECNSSSQSDDEKVSILDKSEANREMGREEDISGSDEHRIDKESAAEGEKLLHEEKPVTGETESLSPGETTAVLEEEIDPHTTDKDEQPPFSLEEVTVEPNKEERLENKEESLQSKEESLEGKEESLENKEESLESKEESLEGKEESLEGKEESLESKEESLESKEQASGVIPEQDPAVEKENQPNLQVTDETIPESQLDSTDSSTKPGENKESEEKDAPKGTNLEEVNTLTRGKASNLIRKFESNLDVSQTGSKSPTQRPKSMAAGGADYDDDPGNTELHLACMDYDVDLVKKLIEDGHDVTKCNKKFRSVLHEMVLSYNSFHPLDKEDVHEDFLELLHLVIGKGLDINLDDCHGKTSLHYAAEVGARSGILRPLAAAGARINQTCYDKLQQTALHIAVLAGCVVNVQTILDAAGDPNKHDTRGHTPLHLAAKAGSRHQPIVEVLLKCGARVDVRDHGERTPLHLAARAGRQGAAQALVGAHADVNARDGSGQTPLHLAAVHDLSGKVTEFLLKMEETDVNAVDHIYWETALHKSIRHQTLDNFRTIARCPRVRANEQDIFGETPMHKAAGTANSHIWKELFCLGGDALLPNGSGFSPLQKAIKAKNHIALMMMRQYGIQDF